MVLSYYLENSNKVLCSVAEENGEILGFQSLQRAVFDNHWGVKSGWGIIGTHIRPSAKRRGIGRILFNETHKAAVIASLPMLDATIQDVAQGFLHFLCSKLATETGCGAQVKDHGAAAPHVRLEPLAVMAISCCMRTQRRKS